MKVLLLSPYNTASHHYWCHGLQQQFTNVDWTYLTLPGRFFSWRIRGNGLTWSIQERETLAKRYDLVLATSMTDLATLRGLCPALCTVPNVLYFHENQFAYPQTSLAHASVEPQMVSLYSALAADTLLFNSDYNRRTFLTGVEQLLARLPDHVPPGVTAILARKAQVLPVPIVTHSSGSKPLAPNLPMQIVWNHRWEYDKGPRQLLHFIESAPRDFELTFHVVGQQFRQQPKEFAQIYSLLRERGWLGKWGFIEDPSKYQNLLADCHVVLSTALHDFQGLAVLQAVAAGCVPIVPRRLAYPEWFGEDGCYPDDAQPGIALLSQYYWRVAQQQTLPPPDVLNLSWQNMRSQYKTALDLSDD